ncbi:hypothetical protein EY643_14645 [Halioglobus maricola]|uniref:Bacterial transcriptional activator domain-containing protein n=1 Tax=Halioglobus maricola TaxID=2601894 RepID=A0A5P9NMD2_9GAMM|nr:hypothetical protein [Halioglobus maricola]QFU76789.1 hypothetical protein EY643_14645 [Halioglobus maricola]
MTQESPGEGLHIRLLGELAVYSQGEACPLPASRKCRALLTWLVLNPRSHRREALCELLWADTDDPRGGLRWALSKLRGNLGDALVADRESVALDADAFNSDLGALQNLLLTDTPDPDQLREAEAALDGGYLPGIDCDGNPVFEQWLETERNQLRQSHLDVLARLQQACADDPTMRLVFARRRVGLDPLDTAANLDLCQALLVREGMASARRQLDRAREQLRDEKMDDAPLLQGWLGLSGQASGAVQTFDIQTDSSGPVADIEIALPELPSKPSVAVLGFDDIGEPSVLSVGLTADLISRLSRLSGLFVIARGSSTQFDPARTSYQEVGRRLGVRYLVHGSAQQQGNRIRLHAELVDAASGAQLWSESWDRTRDDLFEVQDELAGAIVSAVEPEIERAEYNRASLKPPESLDAWENFHMALWHSFRFTAGDTERANSFLARALELDPQFSRAHAAMSLVHFSRAFLNASDDIDREIAMAHATAQESVSLDGRDAMGHWSLGRAHLLSHEHDLAMASMDDALLVNPNNAQGHYAKGYIGFHAGEDVSILQNLDMAQRLSPFDPLTFAITSARALTLAASGQTEEAARWALRATRQPNAHFHIFTIAAICLELTGRREDALAQLAMAHERHPGYTREVFFRSFPHRDPVRRALLEGALTRLGMP